MSFPVRRELGSTTSGAGRRPHSWERNSDRREGDVEATSCLWRQQPCLGCFPSPSALAERWAWGREQARRGWQLRRRDHQHHSGSERQVHKLWQSSRLTGRPRSASTPIPGAEAARARFRSRRRDDIRHNQGARCESSGTSTRSKRRSERGRGERPDQRPRNGSTKSLGRPVTTSARPFR